MGNSKRKLRILSFLGVLILSGGLLLGLFQEARAVNITVTDEPNSISTGDTATFTVSIEIPQGEELPISSVRSVVEKTESAGPDFDAKRDATVVADATCPASAGPGLPRCTQFSDLTTNVGDAVRKIEFTGGSPDHLDGYGYQLCGSYCFVTHTGYDFTGDQNQGYGYERPELHGEGYELDDSTGGYGYDQGTLTLNWDVTVDTGKLDGTGNYWLTFIVNTDSNVLGKLEGKAHYFSVSGGGGPPVDGGGGGGGGARTIGLAQAFDASANERVKIILEGEIPGFQELLVKFNRDCQGCSIHMTSHGSSPPSGADAVPSHARAIEYFTIEVRDSDDNVVEGIIDEGSLVFEIEQSDLDDDETPSQAALMHVVNPWEFEDTRLTNSETDDPLVYNGTFRGFSLFATAVDTQPPEISNHKPTGSTSSVTPTISADFSDNRGINENTLILEVDGREKSGQSGSLEVTEEGFSFVPAQTLSDGAHDVSVTIKDDSGLETTKEWTFRVSDVDCPEPPRITQVEPSEGETNVSTSPTIRVTVQEGSCPIASSVVRVNGQEVSSTLSGGTLTAELSDLGLGETVSVTAIATDTGGNDARKNWQFTTQQQADEPGVDDDGNALVWIIIALVVLAVIGVGAYFYTQQEGGGGGMGGAGGT